MASMDGQEPLGKVLCWAYFVTIYLDADAARFLFLRAVSTCIPIQTNEHSHFYLLTLQKKAPCSPYPKTMEIIGKMF